MTQENYRQNNNSYYDA